MEILDIKIPDNAIKVNIYSSSFRDLETIPKDYTCEGKNISFPIVIEEIPSNAKSMLLFVEDPDAPGGIFRHWIAYINKPIKSIPPGIKKERIVKIDDVQIIQGKNDFGKIGYDGPCPPRGHGKHRYYTIILFLNKELYIDGWFFEDFIRYARDENIVGYGYFIGTYER
ncbi:MAG: YbhB/YbcL family Raf kinase inhibitor-like protein [Candidatus Nanopusillus acidilobi]|jgi:Raf kinase inhibitor-like YbhB/YbcL family protein